ncbi:MAG: hypothetical protein CM1200mP10_01690 [Candidatus Neomarinimicrobiota bacterium]|nr:MAG: hypothetical protein CM1200mP10_01690 [Candidatus Neomarinimicrobiota bacterium]
MSKTKSKRWANGLTIIEFVTTIVILGIKMVGLGLSLRTVTYHYQDDSVCWIFTIMVNSDAEIMKELSLARIINKGQVNGYSEFRSRNMMSGAMRHPRLLRQCSGKGKLFNYQDPFKRQATFPTGRFRGNNQRTIILKEILCQGG